MKRLIVCCDGTWNTPDQGSAKQPTPTNVTRLALAIAASDAAGAEQRVFYHRGVGTTRAEHLRGGAFGFGLARNVRDCYEFLVANYAPGDEIFLFGFSRGAFTARSTAGMVRNSGILRPEHADRAKDAYQLYRSRKAHPHGVEATLFRKSYSYEPRIRLVGVWDTVGALGIPLDGLRFLNRRARFHDTDLSTWVDAAFHAVAIDEQRKPFRPTLWNKQPSPDAQEVQQVWFSGVHCDVGGGYLEHGLSDIPLLWMVGNAQRYGLAVDEGVLMAGPFAGAPDVDPQVPAPDPAGTAHESLGFWYRLLGAYHRPLSTAPELCEAASSSAVERAKLVADYQPATLSSYLAEPGAQVTPVP